MITNEFYSIGSSDKKLNHEFQLDRLGEKMHSMTIGNGQGESYTTYRATTSEDYDRSLAYKISRIKPPYEITKLIEYHLDYYLSTPNSEKQKFIKQIKYVVIPALKKMNNKEVYVDIINDWISEHNENNNTKNITTMNVINARDINAPTQFQQGSSRSTQSQEIEASKDDILKFMDLLKEEIKSNQTEVANDLKLEIEYTVAQLNKGNNISQQLTNIGKILKDTSISVLANIISNPIYLAVKPLLGIQ